jgi:hypothetical protein
MPPIQSHQDLLVHLAGSGDPSAFYTLAAPLVHSTYACLRNQGKSHGEAMTVLAPFLKKTYKNYLASARDNPFNVWYEMQRKKLLPDAADLQNAKTHPENIPAEDISDFDTQMKLVFQINYGRLRRTKNGSVVRPWIFSGFALKFAAAVLCLLAIVIGLQIFLVKTGTIISISISSPGHNRTFSLPPAKASTTEQKPVAATASKADTTKNLAPGSMDSSLLKDKTSGSPHQGAGVAPVAAVNPDSTSRPLPAKKPASSRRRASSASSSNQDLTPAPAQTKPLSDTEAVKSNPVQAEKNFSTSEKTTSVPSFQKKQPASLPDSSSVAP